MLREGMKSSDIKNKWDLFRQQREHQLLKPASLIAAKDSTALFNVAGMQQLIPYLMGKSHPLGKRLYNVQGCVRTNDIEDIGDERHLSYFEMMGNWSLGDYFKKESIIWSIEFLHNELGIPKERIGATIFAGAEKWGISRDTIAEETLQQLGITHIVALGLDENDDSDNFWIAGAEGPCGPCCEFYVDRGEEGKIYIDPITGEEMAGDWGLGVNDRYTEVWNNVFMEFYKNKDGSVTKLPQQNVDTGMGFERISMILQNKETIFETDVFTHIIATIEKYLSEQFGQPCSYPGYHISGKDMSELDKMMTRSYRIVTDHVRSSVMLLSEGILPSNEGRGYVLRRLIRRMFYHLQKMGNDGLTWKNTAEKLQELFNPIVEGILQEKSENIVNALIKECLQFQDTIRKGQKVLDHGFEEAKKSNNVLSGEFVFQAYDTYGIPVELMQELVEAQDLHVDMEAYQQAMEAAREKSRVATKQKFSKGTDWSVFISDINPTEYIGYNITSDSAEKDDIRILKDFEFEGQRILVLNKTIFYAEGGGEIADTGRIILNNGEELLVTDVQKTAGVYLHFVQALDL